jgi:hypothetical protein
VSHNDQQTQNYRKMIVNKDEEKTPDASESSATDTATASASSATTDAANGSTSSPTGRAALLAIFKAKNADMTDEPDDESLMDWAHKGIGERDELEGRYNELNGSNERLASIVSEDPRFAQFIAMVAGGENLAFSLGKCFGNMIDNLDDESLEQLRSGQEEYKAKFQKVKDNFSAYENNLKAYAEENKLDPKMVERINDAILDLAESFIDRDISREVIELVHKGLDADEDKTAELEAAKLAGKNEAIDAMKGAKGSKSLLPDPNGVGTNKVIKKKPLFEEPKVISLAEALKDKE